MRNPRTRPRRETPSVARERSWSRRRWVGLSGLALLLLGGGFVAADWWTCLPDDAVATYVGRQSCLACHAKEVEAWTGSYHDLAMDPATPETVLGDFNDAEFTQFGITSRLYRRDGKYMVRTEGPDGTLQDLEVRYVFGVDPLQQYMVEFDRAPGMPANEIARLQVLRICWDTQRRRWFYLPPPDVSEKLDPDDDLHWTRIAQCWNNMCADCHSTNLQKNFDVADRTYHTTFSEIDVSCETCHGPASLHVELAESRSLFWDRKRGYGLARLKGAEADVQIHACVPCHSRRRVVYPDYRPGEDYYDNFDNELLQSHTYYADGQILDEVYEFASFVQSKMYHKNIRCTDCHDPHSQQTKYPGNLLCTSCHQHPSGKYDAVAHHRHEAGSLGSLCVECHMPETTYMEVDPRRDHSLRVPRPDLSVQLGTPNACTRCHLEEGKLNPLKAATLKEYSDWLTAARNGDEEVRQALARADRWCADKFKEWYGEKEDAATHFAHTLTAARRGDPAAESALIALVKDRRLPAVVRATGLQQLGPYGSAGAADACRELLRDNWPQVRATAVANLQGLPDEALVRDAAPLLTDPIRTVRTEAARILARVPASLLKGSERQSLQSALEEYKRGVLTSNDRAAAHLTLGLLYETLRDPDAARQAYETAIHVEPRVSGPRTNLAALLEQLAVDAERWSAELRATAPGDSVRQAERAAGFRRRIAELRREELELLGRDARLAPRSAAVQYRYGLLLYLHDRMTEAEQYLRKACELEPNTPDFLLALALFYQKQQRLPEARALAELLLKLRPEDVSYRQLWQEIRSQEK